MTDNVNGASSNAANNAAYGKIQKEIVYASADGNMDRFVNLDEAKGNYASIFEVKQNGGEEFNTAVSSLRNFNGTQPTEGQEILKKYLGNIKFDNFLKDFAGFGMINYGKVSVDLENAVTAKEQLDAKVETAVNKKVETIITQAKSEYQTVLNNAIRQAQLELEGDPDAFVSKPSDLTNDGKLTEDEMKNLRYTENDTGVKPHFNSSGKKVKAEKQKEGYKQTVAFLKANGAKADNKKVDGFNEKQTVYEVEVNGETKHVIVDDAGQLHELTKSDGKYSMVPVQATDTAPAQETADNTNSVIVDEQGKISQEVINKFIKALNIDIIDTSDIDGDKRTDTNLASAHEDEEWAKDATGDVENVGVDATTHNPKSKGVVKIEYSPDGLSRQQFVDEGWAASPNRAAEAKVIEDMDKLKGDGKSTRNLKDSKEFAERFLQAKTGLTADEVRNKYKIDLLAKALATANPSIFDDDGTMFKNADFNRINLPKNLERYEKKEEV